MKSVTRVVILIVIITVVGALATLALPVPMAWHGTPEAFHIPLALSIGFTLTDVGAALLFSLSLGAYKTKLRYAYLGMSGALVATTLGALQIPIINAFDLWKAPWVTNGFIGIPFIFGSAAIYISMRGFARLIGFRGWSTRPYYAIPLAVVAAVAATQLPHAPLHVAELPFDASNAVAGFCTVLYALSTLMIFQVQRLIGQHYTRAMTALCAGLAASTVTAASVAIAAVVTGNSNGTSPILLTTECITPFVLMWAGYEFAKASADSEEVDSGNLASILDMANYAAGLVSRPSQIDPILDTVRRITANLKPGETISPEHELNLMRTYLDIEHYLITQEPIRVFKQSALRAQMTDSLRQQVGQYELAQAAKA